MTAGQGVRDELYERLRTYEGRAAATEGLGKDRVNEPMIRHWCEAMGDAHPAYAGPDAVAPPTMLQAWTMGGLSGHTDRSGAYDELFGLLDGAGYTSVVATDCEQEYLRPLRPGDRITFDAVIEAVSERKTTKLGTGYFVTTRMDVRAQEELAGTHRFRILKYRPAKPKPRPEPEPKPRPRLKTIPEPGTEAMGTTTETGRGTSTGAGTGAGTETGRGTGAETGKGKGNALRSRPVINRDNAGFWEGVASHRLLIQRCTACDALRFPWLPGCNACGSPDWDTVEASGEGIVFSHVVMHHPSFPAFSEDDEGGPYAVGLIELAEGVRMVSNVIGVPCDKVRVGMPVRLEFLRTDPDLVLPVFRGSEG
ncbi:OB-fold domain-containing protein [Streptomyces sp. NBC_01220]|uniref:bifunctional MaoC family dehydratase N-terminal/OB-fold nucleic acid binding domain-containing protein n=1 Tax=Streptomyces sp. NBC_01220 TaxID=2903781 RepID=UPI00352C62DF|nr:OB-fold domain-containing protein [Streptomyces sp. NBC_01220]